MGKLKISRKFLIGLLTTAIGVAIELVAKNGLTQIMATFLMSVAGFYFIGNVGEHLTDKLGKRKGRPEGVKNSKPIDLSPITDEVSALREQLSVQNEGYEEAAAGYMKGINGLTEGSIVTNKKLDFIITKSGMASK